MDDGLSDVEYAYVIMGEDAGQFCCLARRIGTGKMDKDDVGERCGSHVCYPL